MAHIEKFKANQVIGIVNHTTRTPTDGRTHNNESIDLERTKFNYELCPNAGYQRFKQRMSEVHCMKRDDVTVLDGLCVTLPSDVKLEDEREFFQAVYEFGCQDFGEENIIYASVHKDEKTPHIHLGFIPVVDDKRRNGEPVQKVNHSKKIPRKYYDTLHTRLSEFVQERLGYEVSILNGATENGNKTITELKTERLQRELDEKKKELAVMEQRVTAAEKELGTAKKELKVAKAQLKTAHEQYKSASRELKTVLNQKSRASEIKTSHIFGETVSYHKSMLEDTRAIGSESYEQLIKAQKIREEVIEREQAVTALEQAVKPLFNKARQQQTQAQRELQQAQQIKKTMEQEVQRRADEQTERRFQRMFGSVSDRRSERLEDFCESIKFSDGQSVLDRFEEQENQLKKRREWSL